MTPKSRGEQHAEVLSCLLIRAYCNGHREADDDDCRQLQQSLWYVAALDAGGLFEFRTLANTHHVIVRALSALQSAAKLENETRVKDWCEVSLAEERARIDCAVERLSAIGESLESGGCPVVVIKSLDHWPDLGSDLDLYTTADASNVDKVLQRDFGALPIQRSWGDRLANKWNYSVPGLPELVEIHVQYLGQTGEHEQMARRFISRRVRKVVDGHTFYVPAPEERIIVSVLQRMYRHFYFRLCDMVDVATLIQTSTIDFEELKQASRSAGIWIGVATFLCLIQSYLEAYGGSLPLPEEVQAAGQFRESKLQFNAGFLRLSKRAATGLYASQLLQASLRHDVRALARLPLLPPLGACALVARAISGTDKGIW